MSICVHSRLNNKFCVYLSKSVSNYIKMPSDKYFLITIDVEDWFQVENFKQYIPFSSWDSRELRVEKNTHRLLDLFDSVDINNKQQTTDKKHKKKLCATFFVLGWLAERLPNLIREIHARGHEIASHGYFHNLGNMQSKEDLRKDLIKSKKLLENIINAPVAGYRAPSFFVTNDILKIIEDCGYQYDSSYNSFKMHGRYGKLSIVGYKKKGIACQVSESFFEIPISNLNLSPHGIHYSDSETHLTVATNPTCNKQSADHNPQSTIHKNRQFILPFGGGGYFRLMPVAVFKHGVKDILKKENAYLFYLHPWEIDPNQPRVESAPVFYKFRHYINLAKTYKKLQRLINMFNNCSFVTCHEYVHSIDRGR